MNYDWQFMEIWMTKKSMLPIQKGVTLAMDPMK